MFTSVASLGRRTRLLAALSFAALLVATGPAAAQPALTCPDDSMFSQVPCPPEFEWIAVPSDVVPGVRVYERYSVTSDVCDVHWWGLLQLEQSGIPCFENPIEFEIAFWMDVGGQPASTPSCTYRFPVTGVPTGIFYNNSELWRYEADLDPCCPMTDGWVSIQAVCLCDPPCWFWWMCSLDGDGMSWRESPDGAGPQGFDMSICLTPVGMQPPHKWLDNPELNPFEPIPIPFGPWHELWPNYCQMWEVIDWVDNGTGVLDPCDYLLMEQPDLPAPEWWHVETVTLTVMFDIIEGPYEPPIYMDWPGPLPPNPQDFNPLGPWHEIFPEFCKVWECFFWQDSNGNGLLDFCDWLCFIDPATGAEVCMHVAALATDIEVVREDPPPPRKWLDNPDLNPFEPIPDPFGPWHELWPNFCQEWTVTGWIDNGTGVLDPCDYLKLEQPTHAPEWWHVETVTVTVFVAPEPPGFPPMYLDWTGPFMSDPFSPIGPWHEVHPNFCREWICDAWDDNGNGVLDPCDWLLIFDPLTGDQMWVHVEQVATDIEVIPERPPCPWDCGNGDGQVNIVDLLALLSQWGSNDVPCDIDGGGVTITDLLALLANWGPCP